MRLHNNPLEWLLPPARLRVIAVGGRLLVDEAPRGCGHWVGGAEGGRRLGRRAARAAAAAAGAARVAAAAAWRVNAGEHDHEDEKNNSADDGARNGAAIAAVKVRDRAAAAAVGAHGRGEGAVPGAHARGVGAAAAMARVARASRGTFACVAIQRQNAAAAREIYGAPRIDRHVHIGGGRVEPRHFNLRARSRGGGGCCGGDGGGGRRRRRRI